MAEFLNWKGILGLKLFLVEHRSSPEFFGATEAGCIPPKHSNAHRDRMKSDASIEACVARESLISRRF